jgi:lactate racemase
MHIELGYDKGTIGVDIEDRNLLGIVVPKPVSTGILGIDEVIRAMNCPIGSKKLRDLVKKGEKVAIVTSDITRPLPCGLILPVILDELCSAGVRADDITVVFALGSHRKHTAEEKRYLVGEKIYAVYRCIDSDPDDCVNMGTTVAGTPVDIFRIVAGADRRVCLGNIEYHYFAGYSGGAKAIMPGVSTRAAIQANHSMMLDKGARAGEIANNPVRQDIDEVLSFVPVDFILNVILDENKNIIRAVAGNCIDAHRAGCVMLDGINKVRIPAKADIVIVSPGGCPKDINLYQAQKALDNARHAVRDGGIIILAASCKEGLGEKVFEQWIMDADTPQSMIDRIRERFVLGGHKAAAIGMILKNARIFTVSDMDKRLTEKIFMEPYDDMDSALNSALSIMGHDAGIIVMPDGSSTLPVL